MFRSTTISVFIVVFLSALATPAHAISFTTFGPNGEGGTINGQDFTIGAGGSVFELDGFFNIGGQDLNGGAFGTSARLSFDPLPVGLDYFFSADLSADTTDLTLTYSFTNNTGGLLNDVSFFSFLDAEIDESTNTFFNEFGQSVGTPATGQTWEIDEPGYLFGNIYDNLLLGSLDNTNAVPMGAPDDVSMALGFGLGPINPLSTVTISMLISEDDTSLGGISLIQRDTDPNSAGTVVTFSGQSAVTAPVPEPATLLFLGSGLLAMLGRGLLRRRP